jgi:hypothetical protein
MRLFDGGWVDCLAAWEKWKLWPGRGLRLEETWDSTTLRKDQDFKREHGTVQV